MTPPPRLTLCLLGGFSLERDAQPCKLAYEKGRALLAYLAMDPLREHSRATLAAMLWPDLVREAAMSNLRLVLHNLRQTLNTANLAAPLLQIDRESVRIDPAAGLEVDVAEFSAAFPACPATPCAQNFDPCLARMEVLDSYYRGEFMAGLSLPDCPDFEEWLQVQRESLHHHALVRLTCLSNCHDRAGAYDKALRFALRHQELEPWCENGLRRVMRLFALNGQRANALAQYEACCRALRTELGVLPSEETQALEALIRRGELTPERRRVADAHPTEALLMPVVGRRQVTVIYCELTPDGVEDPDQALALLRAPQARCSEIIQDYSGYLVQTHGGGLLAYFGYPQANEIAARLAVQASLAIMHSGFDGVDLRVGVHTGVVISGDLGVPDTVGTTTGLAIRLRQLVEPGEVAISDATQHVVKGFFESTSLGLRQLRGIARPLEVFRVDRKTGAKDRLEAAARLTPLIGRKSEIKTLLSAWRDARQGARRIVHLSGEAGIGKSRLVLSLKKALREHACVVCELRCFPEHSQSPFYPVAALFGSTLDFSPDDAPEARFARLAAYVKAHYSKIDRETVPLIARMLSLPVRAPYRELAASPQLQREKTQAILLEFLHTLAAQQSILLVVEDLHWADPSTLELLKLFIAQERATPILTVLTSRPDFQPAWQERLVNMLPLKALPDEEMAMLIAAVAPEINTATVSRIVERADGIPLFAEELAGVVAVNDNDQVIPSTLQDLLAVRLDALAAAKFIAQSAASIGREFSLDLLRRIVHCDELALAQHLRRLQNSGIVQGEVAGGLHFRHALVRDAAYQSQTRAERESTHRRIAAALETGGVRVRPELLAQHWAAGGNIHEAVISWIEAGKLASQHSASHEAVMHFKSGLALIAVLPDSPERVRLELDLQIGLGTAACAAEGYASVAGAEAYARAMSLCSQHESGPEMFRAVWGLWASASSRTGFAHALELAQQLPLMASKSGDPLQSQQGHFAVANTLYWQGEFAAARESLECARTLYQPNQHELHVAEFGEDAGVTGGSYLSWVLWFLGFPDQARKISEQTLALARQLGHPYSLAYALTFASILRCRLRRPEEALALSQETLDLANAHGFPLWQAGATLSLGWALAMQTQPEGVESIHQCVEATRATMGGVTLVILGPLVESSVILGLFDSALRVVDEAFAAGNTIGDRHIEGELHRLKGESILGLADADEAKAKAEACFHLALAVSRKQQAKSLELRAAMSMARLWRRQGKPDDARRLLQGVYDWFTEGFDTPDLRNASEILNSLS